MRLGILLLLAIGVSVGTVGAQDCPAVARVLPVGSLSGTLDAGSCVLTDGSSYTAYRLTLPVRGQIRMDLAGTTGGLDLLLRDASGARVDGGTSIRRPMEAGVYTLLVNGRTPGIGGPFTINSAFTAEPGMLCSNFPLIGSSQTVTSTLGALGCTAPDGSAFDAYWVATAGDGTLTVSIFSAAFAPTLTLRGSDGRVMATATDGVIVTPVNGDSQYSIVVASLDGTGSYRVTTSFQNSPDDTCGARNVYTETASDNTTINADSCLVTIPGSGDQSYYNFYNLSLAAAGTVILSVTTRDFTPTVYLMDDAGNLLMADQAGGGRDSSGNVQSYLRVQLPAGSYRAQVFSDMASGGNYLFQYTYKAGNPQACTVTPLTPGDAAAGTISAATCRTSIGLTDPYAVTLTTPGTLDMDMSSLDFSTVLTIRDLKDNLIARNNEVDGVTASHLSADLAAGVYNVGAAARSGSGSYRLTGKFTGHEIPVCDFTQTLELNGGFIQRLNAASCKGANGQPVDYYGFTLAVDTLVVLVMTSSEVDGFLTLYDATGAELRRDDNSYSGADPMIVQYLPAGAYRVGARDISGGGGGLYRVDLLAASGARPAFCAPRGTLPVGGSVDGNITYTGCQYPDSTFADMYQMNVAADATVDVRLTAAGFDAYLILMDAKGNVVDTDDDGGGNTNSRITHGLAAGTYYIVAKPFGDYLAHGAYRLAASVVE